MGIVKIGCLVALMFSDVAAFGKNYFLSPAFMYRSRDVSFEDNGTSGDVSSNIFTINLTFGMETAEGFLLGTKVYQEEESRKLDADNDDSYSLTSVGLMAGFKFADFWMMASWMGLMEPTRVDKNPKREMDEGSGLMVDFAYLLGKGSFSAGPQLTWSSFDYSRQLEDDQIDDTFKGWSETRIDPLFALLFRF